MGNKKKWMGLAAAGAAIAAFVAQISGRANRKAKPEEAKQEEADTSPQISAG
jgi:hypothetical protein